MDIKNYRNSEKEKLRTCDLIAMLPNCRGIALDAGARDGWYSKILTEYFSNVVALDLKKPSIQNSEIECVKGDITNLDFDNDSFDFVFCAEVLEHIPSHLLEQACLELERVSKGYILIGVPYKQDIRIGKVKCISCGKRTPPWGHVNSFDKKKIEDLFPSCETEKVSYVGETSACTNVLSDLLMDLAGNPYGLYSAIDPSCIHCGARLKTSMERNILQKVFTKLSFYINKIQKFFHKPHPNLIHIRFKKLKAVEE